MAKYLLLKHYRGAPTPVNDVPMDRWTSEELTAHVQYMEDFAARLEATGEFVDSRALSPQGMFVRSDGDGRPPVTDGPFAETKDLIAGWMIIDVETYERAIELAGELSAAPGAGGKPVQEWLEGGGLSRRRRSIRARDRLSRRGWQRRRRRGTRSWRASRGRPGRALDHDQGQGAEPPTRSAATSAIMTVGAWAWPRMIRGITGGVHHAQPIQAADPQLTVHHRGVVASHTTRADRVNAVPACSRTPSPASHHRPCLARGAMGGPTYGRSAAVSHTHSATCKPATTHWGQLPNQLDFEVKNSRRQI